MELKLIFMLSSDVEVSDTAFGLNFRKEIEEVYEGDILEEKYSNDKTVVRWSKAYSGFQWCEHRLIDGQPELEPNDFYGGVRTEYKKVIGHINV